MKAIIQVTSCTSISNILKSLADNGVTPENYHKWFIDLDYSACYYESDTPGIILKEDKQLSKLLSTR